MDHATLLQLILAVTNYCNGPGSNLLNKEHNSYWSPGYCFKTIWECGHSVQNADSIPTKTHNCISDQVSHSKKESK